jgi:hypothetical protein
MVFNATFHDISVLLVEETGGPGENHRPVATPDCIVSYKSNYMYHTITAPLLNSGKGESQKR